jgi:Domain of unknown function (DUF4145)
MFSFELQCPHCLNQEHFKIVAPVAYHLENNPLISNSYIVTGQPKLIPGTNAAKSYGVAPCPRQNCQGPVLIWFETKNLAFRQRQTGVDASLIYAGRPPTILGTWPSAPISDDSENWPEKIRVVFGEIQEDARRNREPARIVGACRSVLELALTSLGYDKTTGRSLNDRIDKARVDGVLTENMKKWAHRTRMSGNEALHELEASQEEALELVNFIRTFLDVSFDLPKKIIKLSNTQEATTD